MKNKFLSKAVPRGTRTIWRYLGALIILFTFAIGNVLANQTDLVTGVTLPDVPASCLDMASQSAYTPDANGWIVFNPYSVTSTWWKVTSQSSQSATCDQSRLDALEPIAPFVPLTSGNVQRINYSGNYAAAVRFKGATNISFLVHPRSSKTFYVGLYSYNPSTSAQELVEEKSVSGNNANVIEYTGLTTSTEYIAYMYGKESQNMSLLELAIKAPVNTDGPFAVTYDKNNEGASGTMTDTNSPYTKDATVTVLGNSFTAPTGMVFTGWNTKADGSGTSYAAGNTFDAVKDVTLFAQWAYPATGTGTITYTLTKGKADVSAEVSGVSTLSSSSTAFSVSTLSIGSSNAKDGYSGQITGHAADYSASQYVALQFTVADGYTFTPSAVSMKVFANSTSNMKMKLVFTDGVTSVESEELACSSSADSDIAFASGAFTGKKFVGNVDVVLYQWGVTSKRTYVKSPVTITGTVAAAAPKYDVIFANGGEGTGDMATLKYEAGEEVTLPACGYTPVSGREFNGWTSSDVTISAGKFEMPAKNVTITATWRDEAVKYTVTYDVNGGSSATPTETDKAAGDEFALADAPEYEGYHFEGWLCNIDGVTYAASANYTMTAATTTFTAQWKPYATATFADATNIIGQGTLDMSAKFSSNSDGAVTYALKEASANASITAAGVFSATVAGSYVVVANQAATATYAATSKEATVTVLDNELTDLFIWKNGTGFGGDDKCVSSTAANGAKNANQNQASTALNYSSSTLTGMTSIGRPSEAGNVTLTFAVTNAYSSLFGIKSICAFGKIEEPAGIEYSWNNTDWTAVAGGESDDKKYEFAAPAGTFPTSLYIRFNNAETGKGGLWLRNALVTLQAKKTVASTVVTLNNVMVNGTPISDANLNSLKTNKSLAISTEYAAAPTVTFVKRTTVNYEGGWAADVTDEEIEVTASDASTVWSASQEIGANTYTVTLAKPAEPSLETLATGITLTSAKIATDEQSFTFSGLNLEGNVTISLESAVAGMSVSPAVVTPTAGAITDEEVTITYKSLAAVAETNVNLVVRYNDDVKIILPVTYSSTVGYEDLVSISAATTWDWNGAASAAVGTVIDKDQMIILANADQTWDENFNAQAIAGKLEYMCRDNKFAQGGELKFNTTVAGKVYVTYSNTGGNDPRTVNVNGTKGSLSSSNNKDADKRTESFSVSAGDVLIKGVQVSDDAAKMLRYYEVRFAPVFAVTYDAGEGSVKGGETMPTQADEAAGEKIILAAATALEKDGYDFAGWLCDIDAQTYQPGDEYTMTAAATTFTAQWVLHVDPVDPTLTYDEGAYTTGGAALDLSSLITAQTSTGAITYSVKTDGGTGAAIDGNNFTATVAGTATITASQAAVLGYNAITVDFDVVVTEATEIDGIKLVEAGALTGNFVSARTLSDGDNTIEGIAYTKYLTMSSTMTSFGNEVAPSATKGIYYYPSHKNIRFYFYVNNNQSSAKKIYIYTVDEDAEGTSDATSANVSVEAGRHMVYADVELTKHAAVVFGVENTGTQICQIVAVESGDELLQGGEAGYSIDYNKCYISPKAGTVAVYDGIEYKLFADAKLVSATNVQLKTLGTEYIKFHLDAPMTVNVFAENKKYYVGSECSTDDAAMLYEATGDGEFTLAAGNWYINGSGAQVKINKLSFMLPKCQKPTISAQPETKQTFGPGNLTATVVATVSDGGTLKYQWYDASNDEKVDGATEATLTTTDAGTYYVIVTNTLADHSDNFVKSNEATLGYRVTDDATLSALSYGGTAITLEDGVYTYAVELAKGTTDVPALAATATMDGYATVTIVDAAEFVSYAASSTVTVKSEDLTVTKVYTVNFAVKHDLPQVDVTASTTWNWANAAETMQKILPETKDVEQLMANIDDEGKQLKNDAEFNSQALIFSGQEALEKSGSGANTRWFAKGGHIKFNVTVPGTVEVEFSDNGNNNRRVKINNAVSTVASANNTDVKTYKAYVQPGEVTLMGVKNDGTGVDQYIRISKIIFTANPTPDYTRNVSNNFGTLCVDHNVLVGGAMGATFYQIASRNEQYNDKIDFEEVLPNEELKAGEPYIFKSTTGKIELYYGETEADAPVAVRGMIGSFANTTLDITEENKCDILYIAQNKLWNCEDLVASDLDVVANRAYIVMSDVPTYAEYQEAQTSNPAPRRRVTLGKNAEQVVTGVENLNASEQPVKLLINGQIFILRGEKLFDATGRLVK